MTKHEPRYVGLGFTVVDNGGSDDLIDAIPRAQEAQQIRLAHFLYADEPSKPEPLEARFRLAYNEIRSRLANAWLALKGERFEDYY